MKNVRKEITNISAGKEVFFEENGPKMIFKNKKNPNFKMRYIPTGGITLQLKEPCDMSEKDIVKIEDLVRKTIDETMELSIKEADQKFPPEEWDRIK